MTIKGAAVSAIVIAGMAAIHFGLGAQNQQPPASQQTHSVWDGIFTDDQAKRGAAVYASECSSCHGKNLNGIDDAPSLVGQGISG
jgi:mono/diheme cytochrome c family protein